MRGKRENAMRRASAALEVRTGGAGQPWRRWEEVCGTRGLPVSCAGQFLDYCLAQGYLTSVDGPQPGPHVGWEARQGGRYWRSTLGATALVLAGAEPGTPIPPGLHNLG